MPVSDYQDWMGNYYPDLESMTNCIATCGPEAGGIQEQLAQCALDAWERQVVPTPTPEPTPTPTPTPEPTPIEKVASKIIFGLWLLPMFPTAGPPLPRGLGIYWPWVPESEREYLTLSTKTAHTKRYLS